MKWVMDDSVELCKFIEHLWQRKDECRYFGKNVEEIPSQVLIMKRVFQNCLLEYGL